MEQREVTTRLLHGAKKIKSFLFGKTNREFLIFLFFVLISSIFWLLQTLNEEYESTLGIPVEYRNIPSNVVITSNTPEEIKVTVKDKGFILLNYHIQPALRPIVLDFKDYQDKGNRIRIPSNEIQRQITERLLSSTRLSTFKPESFDLVYTRGKAKKVPVRIAGTLEAKQQYDITRVVLTPDSVIIYAPQEMLDTIHSVPTASASYHELDDTITFSSELQDLKNVKIIPDKVQIKVCVDQLTEKTLEVPVIAVNVPKGKIFRTFPIKVKAVFQTVLGYYNRIRPENFVFQVDYNEAIKQKSERCPVRIIHTPKNIEHLRIQPQEVDYLIEDDDEGSY